MPKSDDENPPVPSVLAEIQAEGGLSLAAAGRLFPGHRGGRAIDPSTVFRWVTRGTTAGGRVVNRLYIPAGALADLADPAAPLAVTEGCKKALAATRTGYRGCPSRGSGAGWRPVRRRAVGRSASLTSTSTSRLSPGRAGWSTS